MYCGRDCKTNARNRARNEWDRVKRELGPVLRSLADDDPAGFWDEVRARADVLSVWPELRSLPVDGGRPNGTTGWNDSEGGTGKSGSRYPAPDLDRPQIQYKQFNWTTDKFIDNDTSRVCAGGAWKDVWVKLENVTNSISKSGCLVWQLDGRKLAEKHRATLGFPADYSNTIPDRTVVTIDMRGEGCIHYVNGTSPIPDCQACSDRWNSREHDERTCRVDQLCKHDLVPAWCAFCTGKSREPFINQSAENWSQVNRLNHLLSTPREAMIYVEHSALPGNSPARGDSTSGGEGTRSDLDLLADATR